MTTAAIFGLIGVVVGGFLNAAVSWSAERRRDRADARAVSRLIQRELQGALPGLRQWREHGNTEQPTRKDVLRFPAWPLHHLVAARSMRSAEWDAVSDAYQLIYVVRTDDRFAEEQLADAALEHLARTDEAMTAALNQIRIWRARTEDRYHADRTRLTFDRRRPQV